MSGVDVGSNPEQENIFVRIKPHNPKRGHRLRSFLVFGLKFEEKKGWYQIKRLHRYTDGVLDDQKQKIYKVVDVAEYLAEVRNSETDEDSALAFDIATREEASRIQAAEKKRADAERRKSVEDANIEDAIDLTGGANDLTLSDVRGGTESATKKRRARSVRVPAEGEL